MPRPRNWDQGQTLIILSKARPQFFVVGAPEGRGQFLEDTSLTETRPCGWRVVVLNTGGRRRRAGRLWSSVESHRGVGHRLRQLDVRLIQTDVVDAELHWCCRTAAATGWRCSAADRRTQGSGRHVRVPLARQIGAKHRLQQLHTTHVSK